MVTCMEVEDLDDGRLVAEVNKRRERSFCKRTEAILEETGGKWDCGFEATIVPIAD